MFITSMWDVKEPTHYSKRVGHEVPNVVAVLSEKYSRSCTANEMIPSIEMISATEMTPNHHRNDAHYQNNTGAHYRNDPRNIGNEIKRTTKTGQQFSACFLFIYSGAL